MKRYIYLAKLMPNFLLMKTWKKSLPECDMQKVWSDFQLENLFEKIKDDEILTENIEEVGKKEEAVQTM